MFVGWMVVLNVVLHGLMWFGRAWMHVHDRLRAVWWPITIAIFGRAGAEIFTISIAFAPILTFMCVIFQRQRDPGLDPPRRKKQ
jgi:hypothetical protein